jgi:hypothetical protein
MKQSKKLKKPLPVKLYLTVAFSQMIMFALMSQWVGKLISQLEIYDQVRVARDLANATRKVNDGEWHSQQGIALARKIVEFMEQHGGNAECFPYDEISELKAAFWL